MLGRILTIAGVVSALLVGVSLLSAKIIEDHCSTEVLMISPKDADVVAFEKELWEAGDPVADLYGIPTDTPVKLAFIDEDKLIRPDEDPSLALMPVDKQSGENPLQVKTVWFIAHRAAIGFGALSILALLGGLLFTRCRR